MCWTSNAGLDSYSETAVQCRDLDANKTTLTDFFLIENLNEILNEKNKIFPQGLISDTPRDVESRDGKQLRGVVFLV